MEKSPKETRTPGRRGLAASASIGTAILLLTFISLYRAERIDSRAWQVKKADRIDPAHPAGARGMVKFTGVPNGGFITDPLIGEPFVSLRKKTFEYRMVRKVGTDTTGKNGGPNRTPAAYLEGEWVPVNEDERIAKLITVGAVSIRSGEAELIGKQAWSATIFKPDTRGKSAPAPGYAKYELSGITANLPLFCVGKLNGAYLESGTIFMVSAYSEEKTIAAVAESGWIRNFLTFIFLMTGFIVISHPVMYLLGTFKEHPAAGFFSTMGWGIYILFGVAAAYRVVKFRTVTADLLWIMIAAAVAVPALWAVKIIRQKK